MITDKDVEKLITAFKSRQEADEDSAELKEHFDVKFDDVFTKMDLVYSEVLKIREEQTVHAQRHEDINKDLEEIKSIPVIAHALKR